MFNKYKYGGIKGLICDELDSADFRAALRDPDSLFANAQVLKDSRSTKVGIFEFKGRRLLLKRYNPKNLRYILRHLFRKSRPFRHLHASEAVAAAGVPTPRALAAVEERKCFFIIKCSYLITEVIEDLMSVGDYLPELCADAAKRSEFVKQIALLLGRLHGADIIHGDLKLSNIFRCPCGDGLHTGFFDLDGCRIYRKLSLKNRCGDVARFLSSWQLSVRSHQQQFHDIKDEFMQNYPCKLDKDILEGKIQYFIKRTRA